MIPKVIHYCWFGGGPKPEMMKRCIDSWKKYCPDYEIVEWNERNYDLSANLYIQQSYAAKRWAFVTDYVRLDIIYRHGGIYLDTDVEVIRSLDPLLEHRAFAGLENVSGKELSVNTGLGFGAEAGNEIIKDWRDMYDELSFLNLDGSADLLTTPARTTAYLNKLGFCQENRIQLINDMVIYPTEYFSPKQYGTGDILATENTYSIHHYADSWKTKEELQQAREWDCLVKKYGERGASLVCAVRNKFKKSGLTRLLNSFVKKLRSPGGKK